ncbi:GntR family transcriptional regulator [Peribacillus cavernae]|uniref:GntR family transcriptional regulator n=1 Tax=Peribacillus cavernae TaxID=1674310 RepID=A0A433HEA0_9BACI|nr:GntR family transcriptional regulator [Peribacillus cavernae]MDQ0219879.1 GntR family transcriptional regulator [Peribacillus cavernae]RUQ26636.1 GntR family transcriptional regulator [Peribacillus cavernae]
MINKKSPIPIYYQLQEQIKNMIEKGELKPGDTISSERQYAEKFKISRMTIRQALTKLVDEGYLYRVKGKGTFVAERKIEQPLQGLTSFTEDMKSRGMKPGSKPLSFEVIPASSSIANHLAIQEYGPVYEIKRIRLADDVPMALETTYISANLIKGLTEEIMINQSLYEYIEDHSRVKIDQAEQIIESSIADQMESQYLKIKKGLPVMLIQRKSFSEDGTPIEFVKSVYRADRYRFMIHMKR